MIHTIYLEEKLTQHPRAQKILSRFPRAHVIPIKHYGEVFNNKSQNFRIQKENNPALIIAEKKGKRVLPTPSQFGLSDSKNFYFSHLLNCLYDCRYCFLQGMYHSAHYVLFINYEDFMQDILNITHQYPNEKIYFFSGYDSDSLVFESISGFLDSFLPFFKDHSNCVLELRSKSVQIKNLLKIESFDNCICAFSFTPDIISKQVEHKVPPVKSRILAMKKLAEHNWRLGLRFDPIIYGSDYKDLYEELIETIFDNIPKRAIHSVSIGALRFPKKIYQKLTKLYPEDKLLAHPLEMRQRGFSYSWSLERQMKDFIKSTLKKYIPETLLFECGSI